MRHGELCANFLGYLSHGLASLALGDTTTAETDFVAWGAYYLASSAMTIDTVRTHLGPRFSESRWLTRSDSAHRIVMSCIQAQRADAQAHRLTGGS
jgi:hypothetical protein